MHLSNGEAKHSENITLILYRFCAQFYSVRSELILRRNQNLARAEVNGNFIFPFCGLTFEQTKFPQYKAK